MVAMLARFLAIMTKWRIIVFTVKVTWKRWYAWIFADVKYTLVAQNALYETPYLSPSRAGQHIGQCVSSNHLCHSKWFEFSALFLLLKIFYPGGSQAHRGTLLLYPGLGQAQILHVDSTCKTCGGVNLWDTAATNKNSITHGVWGTKQQKYDHVIVMWQAFLNKMKFLDNQQSVKLYACMNCWQVQHYCERFWQLYILQLCKCTLRSSAHFWFQTIEEKRLTVSANQMQQNRFTRFVAVTIQRIKCPMKLHMHFMQTKFNWLGCHQKTVQVFQLVHVTNKS